MILPQPHRNAFPNCIINGWINYKLSVIDCLFTLHSAHWIKDVGEKFTESLDVDVCCENHTQDSALVRLFSLALVTPADDPNSLLLLLCYS